MSAAYALSATMPSDVDMHPLQTSDPQPSTALDPPDASALRQAALKSIRSKRRKPVVEPDALALSARPIPPSPPTLLDYGTEDSTYAGPPAPSTSTTTNGPTPLAAANSFGGASTGEIIPEEDITMREEGEISENEDPPPPPLPSRLPPARSNTSVDISTPVRRSPPKRTTPPLASRPPLPPVKIEPAVPSLSPPRSTSVSGSSRQGHREFALTPTSLNGGLFRIEAYGYVIDAAHVRPGLSLTQDQYNSTKDIVLDLLGWGVPPEYLVDCGLSREIIFYVFTELNLRLPANFDPTGIPPFPPPPEAVTYVPIAPEPPPQDFNGDDPFASSSHPSLPSKPSVPQGLTARSSTPHAALNSLSVDAPPFVPRGMAVAAPEGSDNLAAMEQLKRQELLARKAVQASRRRHETSSFTSADGASSGQPSAITVDTRPVVPQASVDDFLKTIDASSTGSATSSAGPSRDNSFLNGRRAASPDAMDVDDDIPGLGGQASFASNNSQYEDREATPPPSTAMDSSSTDDSPEEMAVELSLGLGLPEDSEMDSGPTPPLSHDNSSRSSSTPQPAAPVPRRGLKRPVAADFVDVDSGASNPYALAPPSRTGSIGNGNGQAHTYGGAHHPNPHVRRRMHAAAAGGFASVSGTRRCVIDISDSEDGDEEEVPVSGTPTTSADDLEVEIQRMRALIKLREEQKLRKLAMSGRATPQSREVPAGQETATQSLQGPAPLSTVHGGQEAVTSTPIDDSLAEPLAPAAPSGVPHATTGEQVLTAEARQEQVVPHGPLLTAQVPGTSGQDGSRGVDVAASAQEAPAGTAHEDEARFRTYDSVLSHYPFLSGRSLVSQEPASTWQGAGQSDDRVPDLRLLKLRAALRHLNSMQVLEGTICQYEVPGGGECRDADCSHIHLSRLGVEPSDEETAAYVGGGTDGRLVSALQEVRARRPGAVLEERVAEALRAVGRRGR